MEIQDKIQNLIKEALVKLDIKSEVSFAIEHPADMKMGDYSTNVAMVLHFLELKPKLEL
jgi:arginyl-tRNA synthetase